MWEQKPTPILYKKRINIHNMATKKSKSKVQTLAEGSGENTGAPVLNQNVLNGIVTGVKNNFVASTSVRKTALLTEADYDALTEKDANTLYLITEE